MPFAAPSAFATPIFGESCRFRRRRRFFAGFHAAALMLRRLFSLISCHYEYFRFQLRRQMPLAFSIFTVFATTPAYAITPIAATPYADCAFAAIFAIFAFRRDATPTLFSRQIFPPLMPIFSPAPFSLRQLSISLPISPLPSAAHAIDHAAWRHAAFMPPRLLLFSPAAVAAEFAICDFAAHAHAICRLMLFFAAAIAASIRAAERHAARYAARYALLRCRRRLSPLSSLRHAVFATLIRHTDAAIARLIRRRPFSSLDD
jgi:hypothetical protein